MPTLEDRLRRCTHSAVHLEMRDGYMHSDPRFAAWQNGVRNDPAESDPERRPWLRLVADLVAQGVEVRRARIVSEPVSDYIRFEHHLTGPNVDDSSVVFNHFGGDGELAPDDEEFTDYPGIVKLCAHAFKAVWALAVPHADYKLVIPAGHHPS